MPKLQNTQNNSKGVIEEIYKQPFVKPAEVKGITGGKVLIGALVLSTLAGFLAGLIEDAWFNDYFNNTSIQPNNNVKVAVPDLNSFIKKEEDQDYRQVLNQLQNQLLGIYRKKTEADVFSSLYLEKDFLGNALAVTSDGWLLTQASLVKDGNFVIIDARQKVLEPLKTVVDPLANVALVKVGLEGLSPARFADFNTLEAGQAILAARYIGAAKGFSLARTSLENVVYQEKTSGKDFLLSTEKAEHYLKLSRGLASGFKSAPIFNARAEVVGLLDGADKSGEVSLGIMSVYLNSAIDNFLASSNQIIRPLLGVRYLDLSSALGLAEQVSEGQKQGAVLFGDAENKINAVAPGSPAEKAGLKAGDIILKINQEIINERNTLTKLIQDYSPGQEITLTVFKKGETSEVKAVLGEL